MLVGKDRLLRSMKAEVAVADAEERRCQRQRQGMSHGQAAALRMIVGEIVVLPLPPIVRLYPCPTDVVAPAYGEVVVLAQ